MRILVTDLDNTLYDWVTFYSQALDALIEGVATLLSVSEAQVSSELKKVHERYGNSEPPFAILELPCVQSRFPSATRKELMQRLDPALHAFNSVRKRELVLYPGVHETLAELSSKGVRIVGHTEATAVNAYYRLLKLGIVQFFSRLYAAHSNHLGHPDDSREPKLNWPDGFVVHLPISDRKPNPAVLCDICQRECVPFSGALYVGDSLTRDIAMAVEANVRCVWARYGRVFNPERWATLVRITHWTSADVSAEEALRERHKAVKPDFVIDSFPELLALPFWRQ